MYYQVIKQCIESLANLESYLDKAESYAAAKKFDVGVLMNSRLAADMQPLIYQVQSACDYVKAAAGRLAGREPPKHENVEQTIDELRTRIRKTVDYARSFKEEAYADASELKVTVPWAPAKVIRGNHYLVQIIIPNVYFHLTTAYAILRMDGVGLGKMDFLGHIDFIDA